MKRAARRLNILGRKQFEARSFLVGIFIQTSEVVPHWRKPKGSTNESPPANRSRYVDYRPNKSLSFGPMDSVGKATSCVGGQGPMNLKSFARVSSVVLNLFRANFFLQNFTNKGRWAQRAHVESRDGFMEMAGRATVIDSTRWSAFSLINWLRSKKLSRSWPNLDSSLPFDSIKFSFL